MTPMAFTALLLLLGLGTGTCAMGTTETTTESTTTDTTTTETTTTETTTTETTTTETTSETTSAAVTAAPNVTISKTTSGNGIRTPAAPHPTAFPATGNTTKLQSGSSSAANSTAAPVSGSAAVSPANATAGGGSRVPVSNTTHGSSAVPTPPTPTPVSSSKGNGTGSADVTPTPKAAVTAQGSTAPRQTPTAAPGGGGGSPSPSKAAGLVPTAVQLLLRVPLSFRILNRSFNESLRDPTSEGYRSLSSSVLTMFESVFGCASCAGRQSYKGCSQLRFSQGSVEVQSVLVFGHGNGTVASAAAEQQLRTSLDQNGFIMDLQLADIQSTVEVTSPAPAPAVPGWAIALLVLVCILLLLSILTCLLMTTCTCRRKSRGKLFGAKDSYHPMAEYPAYQSHGRYVSPAGKPNPYSQVAGTNGAGTGTFTYTNPAASDNL